MVGPLLWDHAEMGGVDEGDDEGDVWVPSVVFSV